jgi:hypothetical protein
MKENSRCAVRVLEIIYQTLIELPDTRRYSEK